MRTDDQDEQEQCSDHVSGDHHSSLREAIGDRTRDRCEDENRNDLERDRSGYAQTRVREFEYEETMAT